MSIAGYGGRTRHPGLRFAASGLRGYGDFIFMPERDHMSDTLKLRRFGFWETVDTTEMFLGLFGRFRAGRIIP